MPGFLKFCFWAERLLIQYQNGLESGKAVNVCNEQSSLFWFLVCTSLIPCHHHWNGRRYWLRRHTEESGQSCKIINMIRVKSLEGRSFIFIFKLNTVLSNSYQVDEIVMDIEEWKQKVPDDYVKSFRRVLLGLSEILIVS